MRTRPAGIHLGKNNRKYLAVYNYQYDVSVMLPPEFSSAKRVAHITYSRGDKKGGVDVFLLNDSLPDVSTIAKIKKEIYFGEDGFRVDQKGKSYRIGFESRKDIDIIYDIQHQIVSSYKNIGTEVSDLTRADIIYFCKLELAKTLRDPKRKYADKIIPVTKLEDVDPERVLTGGKQEFVPSCSLEANIDFGKGCISSWIPGEGAHFDGQSFVNFFSYLWGECDYCYAESKHKLFPKTIYKFDQQRLLEELRGQARLITGSNQILGRPVDILRFGKRTEPWTPFTQNQFMQTLEAMVQTGTKGVLTTKFLPFIPEVVELLKRTNSNLLYSIGFDELEIGPVAYGCDNRFRVEQAIKYKEAGVNSSLYILIHPIFPPTNREIELLDIAKKNNMLAQILPMKLTSRNLAQQVISPFIGPTKHHPWDILKDKSPYQEKLTSPEVKYGESYYHEAGKLIPKIDRFHPFWMNLVKNNKGNIRLCHHDEWLTYCGNCFHGQGFTIPTEHVNINPGGKPKMRTRKKTEPVKEPLPEDPNQLRL